MFRYQIYTTISGFKYFDERSFMTLKATKEAIINTDFKIYDSKLDKYL